MFKIIAVVFLLLVPIRWIYVVDKGRCNGCGNCLSHCPQGALTMTGPDAYIDPDLCDGCGNCVNFCPRNAIFKEWFTGIEEDETTEENMSFSRNPVTSGSVTVFGVTPESEVKVMDQAGRIVIQSNADEQGDVVLDLSGIPEGAYLVISGNRISGLTII